MKRNYRNGSSFGTWIIGAILLGGIGYMVTSPKFEREDPKVMVSHQSFWNFKEPIRINIDDISGLKSFKATLSTPDDEWVLAEDNTSTETVKRVFELLPPKGVRRINSGSVELTVEATDNSLWGFFTGNTYKETFTLVIDQKAPTLSVLTNSYKIQKGGSAIVVFKAEDENLKTLKVETSFGKDFIAQPFMKPGYYATLIAWPVQENEFTATVVAKDQAGNEVRAHVPLRLQDHVYRVSKIELSDAFLDGKIAELANVYEETKGVTDRLEQFKIINETVRANNERLIHKITSNVSSQMIKNFTPFPFYPMPKGQKVADFGDHRIYSYKDRKDFSSAYHMGLDLASTKMGPVMVSNPGKVVFAAPNGIYGNLPIIDHGFGLYTLYGHCSSVHVKENDNVKANQQIAQSGLSGYAMGDHLHFGILVQGIEVRPEEWMDSKWIKDNITSVIDEAKLMIFPQAYKPALTH